MKPDKDLADWIQANTSYTDVYEGDFSGDELPDGAIAVELDGGPDSLGHYGSNNNQPTIRQQRVRLNIRESPADYATARDKAKDLEEALDFASVTGYLSVRTEGARQIGSDDDSNKKFHVVVLMRYVD